MNWINSQNQKTLSWLNRSYDEKQIKNKPFLFWLLKPKVIVKIFYRLLLIGARSLTGEYTPYLKVVTGSEESIGWPTTILEFLLSRRKEKPFCIASKRLKPREILTKNLSLPFSEKPLVSIIIPVYNKIDYTFNCLVSLGNYIPSNIPVEIIVINDNSKDSTKTVLNRTKGLIAIHNPENLGFLNSCNKGADVARGKWLLFLNNDTEVQSGWLESLLSLGESDEKIGAVGSKLIFSNGLMQEAGGIIFNDGIGWNFGRLEEPDEPEFNFVREVDYCSGASLMVRREAFEKVGKFDTRFAPAYYEDTDLCFSLRNVLGLKVMYQPKSHVLHYEGISSGTSVKQGVKRYQAINEIKFKEKWKEELKCHENSGEEYVIKAARRLCGNRTIIIIDSYLPRYDRESGSNRIFHIIKIFKSLNYHVIFLTDAGLPEDPYYSIITQMGVEVIAISEKASLVQQVQAKLSIIDYAWICRPELNQKYASLIRKNNQIKIIYDTVDLHYLRVKRMVEINPEKKKDFLDWRDLQQLEIEMAKKADLTIAITEVDKGILEQQNVGELEVIPNIHVPIKKILPSFKERKGLLFIGGYLHVPNVDAVEWLCNEIMPIVWKEDPTIHVTLLGSSPSAPVLALQSERVNVTGYIHDVGPYFSSHRVFVSPLRYGAGMKGKIGQSLEYSLPVVSTNIGIEGMGLKDGHSVLVSDDAQSFASNILRLYNDEKLWREMSLNAHQAILPFSPETVKETIKKILVDF